MKKLISILVALIFVSSYSISQPKKNEIIKEADLFLDMMEYKAAINNYLEVLSQNPDQQEIRKNIGYAYFQMGKIEDSLKYLKEELRLFPGNGDTYDLLVYILYKHKRTDEAYDFAKRYKLEIKGDKDNPNSGLGDFILGKYLKEKREFDDARISLRRAPVRGYDPVECFVQLADIELVRYDFSAFYRVIWEAKESCKRINEIGGQRHEYFEFYFLQGLSYYYQFMFKHDMSFAWVLYLQHALDSFKESLRLEPYLKDALFNLGAIHYNFKQFKNAAEYFKKILEKDPEDDEIKIYLNCCLEKLSKSGNREPVFDECPKNLKLSKEFIDNPDIDYQYQFKNDILFVLQNINYVALESIRRGRYEEGMKRYCNGLKIYPESPEINFNMGMVYFWQDDFNNAEKHALIAIRRKYYYATMPDILIPGKLSYLEREELLKKAHDPVHKSPDIPLSEWTFNTALKEGNYFLESYDLLGNIYFKKGEYNKAVLAFEKVIDIRRKDAQGHYNLGCSLEALGDYENAEKEWRDAIKYEEELKRMGKRGEISDDQLDVSLIVFNRPVTFRAHKSLGRLYLERNLQDKALKEFKKALELEPDDPEPYYEIGKIYHAKSELDEKCVRKAIFYYEKYLYLGGGKEIEVRELLKSLK